MDPRVLVLTGGLLHAGERSLARALRKQAAQWRASDGAWLDAKVKLTGTEPVLLARRSPALRAEVERLERAADGTDAPELTEALLATLLAREGLDYDLATYDDLFTRPRHVERLLGSAACVFMSATMLRDLGELEPLVARVRRPGVRVVVGGALAGAVADAWRGMDGVDVLAVGDGERLVPALARWMREGHGAPQAPEGGRVERRGEGWLLRAGTSPGVSLDAYPSADWVRSARDHGRRYRLVHHESVRGCPYRCAFCNYPFLFDDARFRWRSAKRVVDDWEGYVRDLGVEYVNCLDSLFTVPSRRLVEVCEEILSRGLRVKWICYARADDLADDATVALMRKAGATLVHVGVESGDQGQLDRMNKRVRAEANRAALANCRRHGVTTLASLVIGYPGETDTTLEATFQAFREAPPDFHFLAVFNTRIEGVPVLAPESRARFGLVAPRNARTTAPYWRHATMDCREACDRARALEERLAVGRVSLNAATFYRGILAYEPGDRARLLDLQRDSWLRAAPSRWTFDRLHAFVDRRLRRDVAALVPSAPGVPA